MDVAPLHASLATRILVPLASGVLLGGLARPGTWWAALVVAGVLAAVRRASRPVARIVAASAAAGVACGALAAAWVQRPLPPDHVARFVVSTPSAVVGTIVRAERGPPRTTLAIRVATLRNRRHDGPATGLLGLTIAHGRGDWQVGERVRVVGRLRRPRNFANPAGYDLEAALARRGLHATMFLWDDARVERVDPAPAPRSPVGAARRAIAARIDASATGPTREYLTAVLLGATQSLDPDTRRVLTQTGLAHVVSVSGFHVAVAAGAWFVVLRWILLRAGALAVRADVARIAAVGGILPVGAYVAIAGGSIPALRSVLMYGVVLAAVLCDRPPDGVRALAIAALALASTMPDVAADVSFGLSFVSVLALVLLARRHAGPPDVSRPAPSWRRTLVVTPMQTAVAATIATAPLTAWHFQQVSLIAPIANLVALPLLGPGTLLPGLAALPLIPWAPRAADALLAVAATAAEWGLRAAGPLARVPWAAVTTPLPSLLEMGVAYAGLALWWWWRPFRVAGGARAAYAVAAVLLLALADVGYWAWERTANPTLRVTFLSVGQGDAAVVELPHGGVLVVDGGGFAGDFDPGERIIAPFLSSRKILRIDALVVSHPQLDHYGGLAHLATRFGAREIWWTGARSSGARFRALERAVAEAGTHTVVLRRGVQRALGGGVTLDVLHPARLDAAHVNDGSLVVRLRFGTTAILFTGDVERPAEREILASGGELASTVLKVAHHGSATSTTAAWLAAVRPTFAVISSGTDNRFGFPAPDVVRRLRAAGATTWNTAVHGAVRVVSDGRSVSVAPFRASARGS